MRFSERQGLRPPKKVIQVDSMDKDLRNRLWNVLTRSYWPVDYRFESLTDSSNSVLSALLHRLWHDYFKWREDTIPANRRDAVMQISNYYFSCEWDQVYDFVEFVVLHDPRGDSHRDWVIREFNEILKEELSGYRFVADGIIPVTTNEEVAAIECAVEETTTMFPHAMTHLRQAIASLGQKPTPDYRNSIKESISAVESVCVAITGDEKATLGQALKATDPKAELHGALRGAFEKLYGYTSDAHGIRHALLEEERLEQEDAVFMLVACSAFISYVIAKHARKS